VLRSSPLVAALLTLATLVLAYGFTPGVDRAAGEQDPILFRNFHDLETVGGTPYRWSKGGPRRDARASVIVVPQVGRGDGILEVQVRSPEDGPRLPLTLSAGDRTLAVAEVQGRRTLSVAVPRSLVAGGDVRVALTSPAWTRGKDPRPRGVAVERVAWHPSSWMLPPARQLGMLPAFAAALALLLRRLGGSSRLARLTPAVVGGLLALAAAWRPLEVAPFTHRLLIGAVLAHAALGLWAALVRAPGEPWWAAPRAAGPRELLLLMGLGYWMLVAYHAALCYETRRFCPTLATAITGLVVLGGVILAAAWTSPRRTARALGLLAAGGVVQAAGAALLAFRRPAVDFATLWTAARDFSLGGSLYKPAEVAANHFGAVFKVPPFYGMLLLPFARFDARAALALDRSLDLALYLACVAVLAAALRPRLGARLAVAAVVLVLGLMQPAFDSIAYGQIDVVLLLLLTLALFALRAGRPAVVGLTVALATLLKLYPLVLVLFLAARREWKAVAWTAAWLVALDALAVAVMGWHEHVVYATEILPLIGGGTGWVENQTVNGFLCRLLAGAHRPAPVHDLRIDVLTWTGFALIAGASALLAARHAERGSSAAALSFGVFLVVMVLAVPAAWIHYETVTILTFLLLVASAAEAPLTSGLAFAAALAFGLIAYGNQWTFYDGSPRPGLTALWLSRELYGLVLAAAAAAVIARSRGPSGSRGPR
ncbi:MAG TPA: glycosyltransferase family 87 protein, partial [Vicinamibacteria bacterium]